MTDLTASPSTPAAYTSQADRVGVIASVLCAIHCAATPFILIVMPSVGRIWSHPASHWIAAAWVVPLASVMVWRGFRRHRKKWIVFTGLLGMSFVLVGAALPMLSEKPQAATTCEIDGCCPSLVQNSEGKSSLHIPPSATVTTLGGLALIITHLGNLCACKNCRVCCHKPKQEV
ncbi:MerC domain-containing protein [Kiritimatiellaeota bacterium B1221]|nr:MerC domain-containing protein [Kiritimatiellaeota bacterium B1221]